MNTPYNKNQFNKTIHNKGQAYYIFCGIYITSILCAMTVSARIIYLKIPYYKFTLFITGGTFIIPVAFFAQDIITEIYGYDKAKKSFYLATLLVTFYVTYLFILTKLPCSSEYLNTCLAYGAIGNALPRHLFAFIISFCIGNIFNCYILIKLKKLLNGKYLPLRFIFSTAIGEIALQFTGTTIAWIGNMHFSKGIIPFVTVSLSYKILFEILMTPFNIIICNKLRNE